MKKFVMYFFGLLIIMVFAIDASAQTPVLGNIFAKLEGDTLITWVIGIIATVFGTGFIWIKSRLVLVAKLAKEAVDVIEEINDSLADDSLTKNELEGIRKELKEVQTAWKELIKKKE